MGLFRLLFGWMFRKKSEFSGVRKEPFHMQPTLTEAEKQLKALVEMEHMVYHTKSYTDTWRKQYAAKANDRTVNEYTFTAWTNLFVKNVAKPYMSCMGYLHERAKYAFVQDDSGLNRLYDVHTEKKLSNWQDAVARMKQMDSINDFSEWLMLIEKLIIDSWEDLDLLHKDLTEKVHKLKHREKQLKKAA